MNNILLLTPLYPATDLPGKFTPVVHYFVKEWVRVGYNVKVIHLPSVFPFFLRNIIKPFSKIISSYLGYNLQLYPIEKSEYYFDHVSIKRIPMNKIIPHSRYSVKKIEYISDDIRYYCVKNNFIPDIIIAHWFNPSLDILSILSKYYDVKKCLIIHDGYKSIMHLYKNDLLKLISSLDIIGYRSNSLKKQYNFEKPYFYCFSGIPEKYLLLQSSRSFEKIKNIVFVGTLIKRKYPLEILLSLMKSFPEKEFTMNYIGVGAEEKVIKKYVRKQSIQKNVIFWGSLDRDNIISILDNSDVFVMISKSEVFGLVYLEAMARGCITIASKDEGFDGIIIDGYNGFLCESGNVNELSNVLNKIKGMNSSDLSFISNNAINTAKNMTDKISSINYINNLLNLQCK